MCVCVCGGGGDPDPMAPAVVSHPQTISTARLQPIRAGDRNQRRSHLKQGPCLRGSIYRITTPTGALLGPHNNTTSRAGQTQWPPVHRVPRGQLVWMQQKGGGMEVEEQAEVALG